MGKHARPARHIGGQSKTRKIDLRITAPRRHSNKNVKAWGNTLDLRDILEDKAKHARSIYGSRGRATMRDNNRHAGYSKSKSGRAEHSGQDPFELCSDIAQYRGAAHPLCFTDEVMDHQIPEGFKPVNIESYDGTTNPAVWIEDFLLHIQHGSRR